ncbi:MAG TPA: tail fiber domain-containing protein [Bacteroidia bacterium]|jgi:hypothetical protein|nr:tail fiber domain-containing protein [Bacteroidia bacterium]
MKKIYRKIAITIVTILSFQQIYSQGTNPTHLGIFGQWEGWNGLTPFSFDLEHRGGAAAQTINFKTNTFNRMIIANGPGTPGGGRIAMGDALPNGFVPTARLHLHEVPAIGGSPFLRFTAPITGTSATDGLEMGISSVGFASIINWEPTQQITINTNNGSANNFFERLRFNAFNNNGFIGIGNSAAFTAASQVHINTIGANAVNAATLGNVFRSDGPVALDNKWQLFTGTAPTTVNEIFNVIVPATGNHTNLQTMQNGVIRLIADAPSVAGLFNSPAQDIMIDNDNSKLYGLQDGGHWVGMGRIFRPSFGLNNSGSGLFSYAPQAHLHISGPNNTTGGGYVFGLGIRNWFNTGTLCTENTDGMYVGLKNQGPNANASYAIINWSDDNYGTGGSDFLSINFTSYPISGGGGNSNPLPSSNDGMEVARFDPGHNNGTSSGTFGVGNFFNIGPFVEPTRRVEILDADPLTGTHLVAAGIPQLRLTYTYDANLVNSTTAINSEFQCTNKGDLFVETKDYTQTNTATQIAQERFFGFHKLIPGNTVEINSQLTSATVNDPLVPGSIAGTTGASGLRFTDLTTASTPLLTNPFSPPAFLTVNANGDVILSTGSSAAGNGFGYCPSPTLLTGNAGIDFNGFNFYYSGQNATNDMLGVGIICGNPLVAKVDVLQSSGVPNTIGVNAKNTDAGTSKATPSIGVKGVASNGGFSTGGWFEGTGSGGTAWPYGIIVPKGGGGVAIGINTIQLPVGTPGSLLEVGGNIWANGTTYPSDSRFKKNVQVIGNALAKVRKVNGVYFNFDTLNYPDNNFSSRQQVGFIAQNVDSVIPQVISTDANGFYSLEYNKMVSVLWQAVKQLDSTNQSLQNQLNQLANCCSQSLQGNNSGQGSRTIAMQNIELSDMDIVVLNQNNPNPYAEQTTITYNVPTKYSSAQILFYDNNGRLIKSVDVTKGKGQLNVYANDLTNGVYSYTLIVDGKIMDTKKMVKQN